MAVYRSRCPRNFNVQAARSVLWLSACCGSSCVTCALRGILSLHSCSALMRHGCCALAAVLRAPPLLYIDIRLYYHFCMIICDSSIYLLNARKPVLCK